MSEQDHPQGASTRHQLALVFVSGALSQNLALRSVLQLLRRKYPLVEHVIAAAVSPRPPLLPLSTLRRLCQCVPFPVNGT